MSTLHESTFAYLKPTDKQMADMNVARAAVASCAATLDDVLPEGADKLEVLRMLRTVGMWANVCITRTSNGTPRED